MNNEFALDVVRGKLPNPLIFNDGTTVKTKEDWALRRREIIDSAIELEYGGMPPEPEYVELDPLHTPGLSRMSSYRVFTATRASKFCFTIRIYRPRLSGKCPVLLTGDGCFKYCNDAVIEEANKRGIAVAIFNRTEFAPDIRNAGRTSGIYGIYPEHHFGAMSAWAWGYMRAVDALFMIDYIDTDNIAITGHSRGAKTVLLAGALDTRIKYVNPNDGGAHGCGCYRYEQNIEFEGKTDIGKGFMPRNERLEDLFKNLRDWMGQDMEAYIGREEELPHDMHFIKALVAPRYLLETNGRQDTWSNPHGCYQTFIAAKEIFKLLGCEKHLACKFREGGHFHMYEDFLALLDFIDCIRKGEEVPEEYYESPYPDMEFMGIEKA